MSQLTSPSWSWTSPGSGPTRSACAWSPTTGAPGVNPATMPCSSSSPPIAPGCGQRWRVSARESYPARTPSASASATRPARWCDSATGSPGVSRGPLVLILCGVSGTGKSTVAQQVAELSGWPHLSSDVTRKRLAGLGQPSGVARRLLANRTIETYRELGMVAAERLERDGGAIVDATFHLLEERDAFRAGLGDRPATAPVRRVPRARALLLARIRERALQSERVSDADTDCGRTATRRIRTTRRSPWAMAGRPASRGSARGAGGRSRGDRRCLATPAGAPRVARHRPWRGVAAYVLTTDSVAWRNRRPPRRAGATVSMSTKEDPHVHDNRDRTRRFRRIQEGHPVRDRARSARRRPARHRPCRGVHDWQGRRSDSCQ